MNIKKFEIYMVNFNPARGTMPGKTRPALIIQTNSLNRIKHPSTVVIPLSSQTYEKTSLLRYKIMPSETNGLEKVSFVVVDQITTIDNKKFISKVGYLDSEHREPMINAIKAVLDLH